MEPSNNKLLLWSDISIQYFALAYLFFVMVFVVVLFVCSLDHKMKVIIYLHFAAFLPSLPQNPTHLMMLMMTPYP